MSVFVTDLIVICPTDLKDLKHVNMLVALEEMLTIKEQGCNWFYKNSLSTFVLRTFMQTNQMNAWGNNNKSGRMSFVLCTW